MPRITRLDPVLINKIAAGEVIERPASVVKELMENALDAGATRITVDLEDGGMKRIAVTDDGGGIAADDLPLAVASHATSKVRSIEDLSAILTMGFRGEALASIASISRMRIVSRPADAADGAAIEASEGEVSAVSPCAAPPGTTIDVRNLFYNVPARRKYVRTASAEVARIGEQVARIALPNPHVGITQTHNGRTVRSLPPTDDARARIADFFGAELAEDLIPIRRDEPGLRVRGFFAPPAKSKASARWQYCFLNGRYIRDRDLSGYVLREAFRGLIEPARYPVVFLFLTADPESFDVNVHPTKIEVRWRDAGRVKSQVLGVLREALLSRDLTPALRPGRGDAGAMAGAGRELEARMRAFAEQVKAMPPTYAGDDPYPAARSEAFDVRGGGSGTQPGGHSGGRGGADHAPRGGAPFHRADSIDIRRALDALYQSPTEESRVDPDAADRAADRGGVVDGDRSEAASHRSAARQPGEGGAGRPAASPPIERMAIDDLPRRSAMQIHNMYLVCETEDGLIVIDQHALHERIMYEELTARIHRGPLESQQLLLPETFDASPEQIGAVEESAELLRRLGLDIAPFGPRTVALRAVPSLLGDRNARDYVSDVLDKLSDSRQPGHEALLDHLVATMACKAAIKAGDPLSPELIQALLARRHLVDRSSNCPHGRPTTLRLTMRDLERQFKRS
jgi:DNA mismatch repair protein MutL